MINNQNLAVLSEKVAHLESAVKDSNEASEISYDNTDSGLTAEDVQAAIDEISGAFIVDTVQNTFSIEVSANAYSDYNTSVSKEGYTPVGVMGYEISGGARLATAYCALTSSSNIRLRLNNYTSSTISIDGVKFIVLFKKN